MKRNFISYQETNKFSDLVVDYINQDEKLRCFINHFPTIDSFKKQIQEKTNHLIDRKNLVKTLKSQNSIISLSSLSSKNIDSIISKNSFTITTGHQLCLCTGPLYFIYKILSTINLSEELNKKYPKNNFIPVFWMASEDHDFEEVNHINLFKKKILWKNKQKGAVGRIRLDNLPCFLDELECFLDDSQNSKDLISLFRNSYLKYKNLADATRFLVNNLFGKYGLVIIDGDDKRLKKQFIPIFKKDILQQELFSSIQDCSDSLSKDYKVQAYVRKINCFKLSNGGRDLIEESVLANDIDNNPEKFSPNVLLRPLYQETVLPNIATIGGGGEISYWMQLRKVFKQERIPFPILLLRHSVLVISEKQDIKFSSFGFKKNDIFKDEYFLQKKYTVSCEGDDISLKEQINSIEDIYQQIAVNISDKGIRAHVFSKLIEQTKTLEKLEKRLLNLAKKKYKIELKQISKIKQILFPANGLQERYDNFIPFYLLYGKDFIKILKDNLEPLNPNFVVLTI